MSTLEELLQAEIEKRKTEEYQLEQEKKRANAVQVRNKKKQAKPKTSAKKRKGNVVDLRDHFNTVEHTFGKDGIRLAGTSGEARHIPPVDKPVAKSIVKPVTKPAVEEKMESSIEFPRIIPLKQPEQEPDFQSAPFKSQNELDYEMALALQAEFDREQVAEDRKYAKRLQAQWDVEDDTDRNLAAKLQVEERTKVPIDVPGAKKLRELREEAEDKQAPLDRIAADVFSAGLMELPKLTPTTSPAPKPVEENEAERFISGFVCSIFIRTCSLTLVQTALGGILNVVYSAISVHILGNQQGLNVFMNAAASIDRVAYNQYGFFGTSSISSGCPNVTRKANQGLTIEEIREPKKVTTQSAQLPSVEDVEDIDVTPRFKW